MPASSAALAADAPEAPPRRRARGAAVRRRWSLGAVAVAVIVAVALTPNFLTVDNVRAILRNASIVGIVAVAMTPITLSGNFVSLGTQQSAMAGTIVVRRPRRDRLGRRRWRSSSSWSALVLVGILQGVRRRGRAQSGHHDARRRRDHLRRRRRSHRRPASSASASTRCRGATPPSLGIPLEVLVFALFTVAVGVFMAQDRGRPRDDARRRQQGHRRGQRHLLPPRSPSARSSSSRSAWPSRAC